MKRVGVSIAVLGAALLVSPRVVHRAIFPGAIAVLVAGVFQELIQLMLQQYDSISDFREFIYTWEGLSQQGAAIDEQEKPQPVARPRRIDSVCFGVHQEFGIQ